MYVYVSINLLNSSVFDVVVVYIILYNVICIHHRLFIIIITIIYSFIYQKSKAKAHNTKLSFIRDKSPFILVLIP